MSEKKSDEVVKTDLFLRKFREIIAAAIAVVIVVGTVVMLIMAIYATGNDAQFGRIKDLLLILNPLLGVVLGYYFNKVSTEARAENAESTAQNAVATAQEAGKARESAEKEKEQAKADTEQVKVSLDVAQKEVKEVKTVLGDMTQTAEKMLMDEVENLQGYSTTRGGLAPADSDPHRDELMKSLQRAKQYLD